MTHGKTYNKSPRRINHKATRSKKPDDAEKGQEDLTEEVTLDVNDITLLTFTS